MHKYKRVCLICIITVSIAASLEANGVYNFRGSEKTLDSFIIDLGRDAEIQQDAVTAIKRTNVSDDKILLAWARLSLLLSRSGLLEDYTDHWLRTTDAVFSLVDLDKTSAGLLDALKSNNKGESGLALDSFILQLGDENPQVQQDAVTAIKEMNVSGDKLLLTWAKVMRLLGEGKIDTSWLHIEDAVFRLIDLNEALDGLLPLLKSDNKDESILARFVIKQVVHKLRNAEIKPLPDTAPLIAESLRDSDAEVRETASRLLGTIPSHAEVAVPVLINALNDENHGVRSATVYTLGDVAKAIPAVQLEIIEKLIEMLNTPNFEIAPRGRGVFSNFHVRVAGHLGSIGAAAVPLLLEAMNATDAGVRHHAAIALAEIGSEHDEATIPILIEALASPHRVTREFAVYRFVDLAKRQKLINQVLQALVRVLESTDDTVENRVARPTAVSALYRVITFSIVNVEKKLATPVVNLEKKLEIVEKLIATLNTPNFVIGNFGRGRHYPSMSDLSNFHVDVARRLRSIGAAAVPFLLEAMNATDASVRHHAAIALAWIDSEHGEATIPILDEALASPHLHTRLEAIFTLARLAERAPLVDEITPILVKVLETTHDTDVISHDMTFHDHIITTLKSPTTSVLLRSEHPYVQDRVLYTIAKIGASSYVKVDDAIPIIKELLSDEDESKRQLALQALIALDRTSADECIAALIEQ